MRIPRSIVSRISLDWGLGTTTLGTGSYNRFVWHSALPIRRGVWSQALVGLGGVWGLIGDLRGPGGDGSGQIMASSNKVILNSSCYTAGKSRKP